MASEKAKELAAKQKAAAKAEKLRKKNSKDPADWGQFRQLIETYKITRQHDRYLGLILFACFAIPFLIFLGIGIWTGSWLLWPIFGISLGMLVAMLVFVERAKSAAYRRYEGQPGSAEVALSMLPKKWISSPAINATRQLDVVHRTVGPGGIVLIGEGEPGRLKKLLASEVKRHEQVAYGVAVTSFVMGNKEGQVPLSKLSKKIKKLPKVLSSDRVTEVRARLKALDNMSARMSVPKGPLPNMKGSRRALRGR
ncbi:MAG: hypothetical protein CR979_02905 [Propionibacterium sp.]|nr:MAG: hypothetical protein CR979_02905 [Propionibacterium sp.]